MDIRIVKKPEHGKAEVSAGTLFVPYGKDTPLAKCNGIKAPALSIKYKSAEHFVGKDAMQLLVFWDGGWTSEIILHINVR